MASVRTLRPPVAAPPEPRPPTAPAPTAQPPSAADFPGCKPVHLAREELEECEMRLEYWDKATETAWICDPVSSYHEGPSRRLVRLAERIAEVRGALVECLGSTDLTERDEDGEPQLIMQADEMVYLHPARVKLPRPALTIGEHDFPEVVLEVDHSTDARQRKLGQYQAWGFPEVWIEVPEARAASRPRSRRSGLTIHLLEAGAYREAAASRAFPGWTAEEIHAALNEERFTAETSAVLERVGTVLGEREGTGPDDDPLLGAQRRRSHARGHAEGRAKGHAEGRAKGHAEGRAKGHAEGRAKGHEEGRAKGHEEGHAKGRAEGRREGELRGTVATIEGLLGHEVPWSTIEAATGIDEAAFRRLRQQIEDADDNGAAPSA